MDDIGEISTSLTFSEGAGFLSAKPLLFDISLEVCRKTSLCFFGFYEDAIEEQTIL
jgi:hypothetical protein